MFRKILGLLTGRKAVDDARPRLMADERPPLIYAVGDVHGCLTELERIEAKIIVDSAGVDGQKWIVMLGDYVDRGPKSSGVIDHLMAPAPAGFRRICLAGNHEHLMLEYLANQKTNAGWLPLGGMETLSSYGISPEAFRQLTPGSRQMKQTLESYVPQEHIDFLRTLPTLVRTPGFLFVHAGLRPQVPLDQQTDHDLMWIRDEFLLADKFFDDVIVHGHTPTKAPEITDRHINVDTAAFRSGVLTAVRISADGNTQFIDSR